MRTGHFGISSAHAIALPRLRRRLLGNEGPSVFLALVSAIRPGGRRWCATCDAGFVAARGRLSLAGHVMRDNDGFFSPAYARSQHLILRLEKPYKEGRGWNWAADGLRTG